MKINIFRKSGWILNIPFLLFVVMVVLRCLGLIGWSWWWITAPLWIWPALFVVMGLIIIFMFGITLLFTFLASRI